jgi:uncharacterized protein
MLIKETFRINAPIMKLYRFFLDAQTVGACIPGCEQVEIISENEYDSIIKTKVGIISANFKVRTLIAETVPYTLIRTVGHGKETRNLGQFRQKTEIALKELAPNETEVFYEADVTIVGKLATFGDRILKSKAKTLGAEFVDAVTAKLNSEDPSVVTTVQSSEAATPEKSKWGQVIKTIINKGSQSS